MAELTACPSCYHKVSKNAESCPKCGETEGEPFTSNKQYWMGPFSGYMTAKEGILDLAVGAVFIAIFFGAIWAYGHFFN